MYMKYLLHLVKDVQFAMDSYIYSIECDVPLDVACNDIFGYHVDMIEIAVEEGSSFFD